MQNSKGPGRPKLFLVVSTTGIGDTLMGTPAIRALRESFPQSQIHFLVNSKRRELLAGNPYIDRILNYRNNPISRGLFFLKTLPYRYDHVLVFHANDDIWKIIKKIRYGDCHNRQGYKDFKKRIIPLDPLPKHSVQKRLALIEKVGGKNSQDYRYDLFLQEESCRWAKERLARWGLSAKDRLVGMQIGAADAYRRWPLESFVEVAKFIRARHGAKIYLNASDQEQNLAKEFQRLLGDREFFHHPGKTLSQTAALIKSCSLFISNDTGPMHMAIALQVPLIALFTPSDPKVTGPIEYDKAIVIRKETPCKSCLFRGCRENFCMKQISVEEVCRAVDQVLSPGLKE